MKFNQHKLFTAFFICLFFSFIYSMNLQCEYKPLKLPQVAEIANSTKRLVVPLHGIWERSIDGNHWENVKIPFTDYEEGKIFYKKDIKLDNDLINSKNLRLYFLGLAAQVEIYFNGNFITKIDGNFLPAEVMIQQKLLINGNNEIRLVFLENSAIERVKTLAMMNAPKIAKGIIREPFLIGTSQIFVSEFKYKFTNNLNNLEVNLQCYSGRTSNQITQKNDSTVTTFTSKTTKITAEYQIIDKRTNIAVTPLEQKEFLIENSRTVNLKLSINSASLNNWSINSPDLYKFVVRLKQNGEFLDEYFVNIGKKNISANNQKIFLNGEPIELKAVTYNEYFVGVGNTLSAYRIEEDIKNIKLLGANAIRILFGMPHPYLAFLCDKYGLLLLIDIPLINTNRNLFSNEEFVIQNKNIFTRMLQNYSNSTSFVAAGIGHSAFECEKYHKLAKQLLNSAKNNNKIAYKTLELGTKNFDFDGYDFLCIKTNHSFDNSDKIAAEIEIFKQKCRLPLILAASSSVTPRNFNGYSDPTSNEFQTFFIKNCYNIAKQREIAGFLINSYNDYATQYPILTLNYHNQYFSTNGITDSKHSNRPSVATIKALFNNERLPLLNAGSYSENITVSYIIIGLLAAFMLIFMNNKYNRFREYFVRAFLRPYNFFADIRDQRIMSIIQTLILGFIIAISISLYFCSIIANMRSDANCSYLFTVLLPFQPLLEILFKYAWKPESLLAIFSILSLGILYFTAVLLRVIAAILRARLFIDNMITVVVWAALPFILLIPFGIILVKLLLVSVTFLYIFFAIMIFVILWSIFRLFKAFAIVFDKSFFKIYCLGILFLGTIIAMNLIYYESSFGLFSLIEYFLYFP